MPHSTWKGPALVWMIVPLLAGQETVELAAAADEVDVDVIAGSDAGGNVELASTADEVDVDVIAGPDAGGNVELASTADESDVDVVAGADAGGKVETEADAILAPQTPLL